MAKADKYDKIRKWQNLKKEIQVSRKAQKTK